MHWCPECDWLLAAVVPAAGNFAGVLSEVLPVSGRLQCCVRKVTMPTTADPRVAVGVDTERPARTGRSRHDEAAVYLPVNPPVRPMLAALSRTLPEGDYRYEPKWHGFRP